MAISPQTITRLRGMDYQGRIANGCIGAERADLVLAGCAILDAIRRRFRCPGCGWRIGVSAKACWSK